jgi:GNAT superfamily N-acetyltransferase
MQMLVRLIKTLASRSEFPDAAPFRIRTFQGECDIPVWLEIRERALAGQIISARPWAESDFRREFVEKPWWRPEWMWFAEMDSTAIGAVALRPLGQGAASIQWLLVTREHRRRGAGRLLISTLESAAWEAGYRTIVAETLAEWTAAIGFYVSMGYRPE